MEEIQPDENPFLCDISHELRTPLTLIISPLQELLSSVTGHWEARKAVVYPAECKKTVAFGQSTDGLPACRIGYF